MAKRGSATGGSLLASTSRSLMVSRKEVFTSYQVDRDSNIILERIRCRQRWPQ